MAEGSLNADHRNQRHGRRLLNEKLGPWWRQAEVCAKRMAVSRLMMTGNVGWNTPGWNRTNGQPLRRRLLYPLSYGGRHEAKGKRETRFELATSNLEGWHSTTELLPQTPLI